MTLSMIYLFLVDPVYESYCHVLLVDDDNTDIVSNYVLEDFMMQSLGKSDPVITQLEILRMRPIIEQVIEHCDMRDETGKFLSFKTVLKKFQFEHVASTNLIKIRCRDKMSEKAALYANILAEVFLEQNQNMNREEVVNVKRFLENQLIVQKRKVDEAEKTVIDFKIKSKTVSLSEETSMRVTAVGELEAERIKLESELRGLQAQNAEIERRLNATGSQAAPGYSSLAMAREQINISMTNVSARLRAVKIQISRQYKNMKDIPPLEILLAKLEREERVMNEIYTNLLAKYEEYKIREAAQVGSIKIVEKAIPVKNPVFPQKKKGVVLAGLAGLFLGLTVAFGYEYIKDRPHSIKEIEKVLKTDSLGAVPYLQKEKQLFIKDNPKSVAAEALRLIGANLKYKNIFNQTYNTVMITSAQPGEGKSLIAANLAASFAFQGRKTALVSLDLRRPSFERVFGIRFGKGITDYLIDEASFGQIVWTADFNSNLVVISSGRIPPNPNELAASLKMETFMKQVASSFEIVIFDTAPVTMVAETIELAKEVDGIILVSDHSGTSRKRLFQMQNMLMGKRLPVLGVIVNKVAGGFQGDYRYYGYDVRNSKL
ncbi:MAG: GumC family protein [Thermotogota bacterium]